MKNYVRLHSFLTAAKNSMSLQVPMSLHVGQSMTSHASPANMPLRQEQTPVDSSQTPPAEHWTDSPVRPPSPPELTFHAASSNHATPLSQSCIFFYVM